MRYAAEHPEICELEQIVIVIEQGTVVQFNQTLLFPGLEGMHGDGI